MASLGISGTPGSSGALYGGIDGLGVGNSTSSLKFIGLNDGICPSQKVKTPSYHHS